MKLENHHIDQLFKEKLGDFEKNPPVDLLEQINQKMIARSKVRRINQFKTAISIAAALILIAVAGWYTSDQNQMAKMETPASIQQNTYPNQQVPEKEIITPKTADSQLAVNQKITENNIIISKKSSKISGSGKKNIVSPSVTSDQITEAVTENNQASATRSAEEAGNKSPEPDKASLPKDIKKFEPETNKFQRKKEPDFFADSRYNNTNSTRDSKKGSWGLKAEVSPMVSAQNQANAANTKSVSTVGGGMIASYKLNDKLTISSGIRFSQMKQGTHSDYTLSKTSGITYLQPVEKEANIARDVSLYLPATSSIVYSNGMQTNTNNVFVSDLSQDFKYLEIPIQATYKLIDQKFTVGVTGGLSTNFLVGNVASITENGIRLSKGNTDNLRDVLYSGSAGIEFGYDLGKNLILTIEPRVKQYLHSISSNQLVNYKPMQLGIFTGISFSFN